MIDINKASEAEQLFLVVKDTKCLQSIISEQINRRSTTFHFIFCVVFFRKKYYIDHIRSFILIDINKASEAEQLFLGVKDTKCLQSIISEQINRRSTTFHFIFCVVFFRKKYYVDHIRSFILIDINKASEAEQLFLGVKDTKCLQSIISEQINRRSTTFHFIFCVVFFRKKYYIDHIRSFILIDINKASEAEQLFLVVKDTKCLQSIISEQINRRSTTFHFIFCVVFFRKKYYIDHIRSFILIDINKASEAEQLFLVVKDTKCLQSNISEQINRRSTTFHFIFCVVFFRKKYYIDHIRSFILIDINKASEAKQLFLVVKDTKCLQSIISEQINRRSTTFHFIFCVVFFRKKYYIDHIRSFILIDINKASEAEQLFLGVKDTKCLQYIISEQINRRSTTFHFIFCVVFFRKKYYIDHIRSFILIDINKASEAEQLFLVVKDTKCLQSIISEQINRRSTTFHFIFCVVFFRKVLVAQKSMDEKSDFLKSNMPSIQYAKLMYTVEILADFKYERLLQISHRIEFVLFGALEFYSQSDF